MRVVSVGDAVDRIVGPIQGASLDGRFETRKDFQIRRFAIPTSGIAVRRSSVDGRTVARTLIGLKFKTTFFQSQWTFSTQRVLWLLVKS